MLNYNNVPTSTPDWDTIEKHLPWMEDMQSCIQDKVYHAEGDVWTHTKMVVQSLLDHKDYKTLPEQRKRILFWAALLHDIAKPKTRDAWFDDKLGRERISHPNHSRLGEQMTRPFLWKMDIPMREREEICSIIRYHQRIFHLLNARNPLKQAIEISLRSNPYDLYLHAIADHRGRINLEEQETELQLDLTLEYLKENNLEQTSWPFANSLSQFEYFNKEDRDPHYSAFEDNTGFKVIMLSGLPGSGKDHLIPRHYPDLPVISLDDIRQEIKAPPTGNQGAVIQLANERAKQFLRQKQSFVWNATNLTRDLRSKPLRLFTDYGARTIIHYIEVSHDIQKAQNKNRDKAVPENVIQNLLYKWQPPEPWEAVEVIWQAENTQHKKLRL